ncbi:peptidase domain-containing ABC transporter [Nitrospirillum amazonense]|nr:peptidase domain-containing ABC transporter [Nitrospirillum amazonense]
MQSQTTECGLACLAMVSTYYGSGNTLLELRLKHSVSLNGLNVLNLKDIAEEQGFEGRVLKLPPEDVSLVKCPALLYWNAKHYVVLHRVIGEVYEIYDPASGIKKMPAEAFREHYSGIVLELSPTPVFTPRTHPHRLKMSHLLTPVTRHFSGLLQIFALSVVLEFFSILYPLGEQAIIDRAVRNGDTSLVFIIAAAAGSIILIRTGVTYLRGLIQVDASSSFVFHIRQSVLRHIFKLPVTWFETRRLGDIVSRINSIQPLQEIFTNGITVALIDAIMAVVTLACMAYYSLTLTLIVTISVLIFCAVRLLTFPVSKKINDENVKKMAKVDSVTIETIRGIRVFKIFGKEGDRYLAWKRAFVDALHTMIRMQKISLQISTGTAARQGIESLLVLSAGAVMVIKGQLTLGMLIAFQAFRLNFSESMASVLGQYLKLRMLDVHLDRISDIVCTRPELAEPAASGAQVAEVNGGIELRNVSFQYSRYDKVTLSDVNLAVRPGEFVVFTGISGGGKTTLVKIMMGLYKPTTGQVLLDGRPMTDDLVHMLRDRIGVVMQDDMLFSGTVAENIAFFTTAPDMAAVMDAARQAQIHDDIMKMPMAYNTLVGELGSTLSGGQRQRVLLARALYRKPAILFLDEGTSNLDVQTEKGIMDTILSLNITRVAVAHRPVALKGADRIFAVGNGRVDLAPPRVAPPPMPTMAAPV